MVPSTMRVSFVVGLLWSTLAVAETFDVVTYTPPPKWAVENTKSSRVYTRVDRSAGTYCRVTLYASVPTTGSAKGDFDADWRDLAGKFYPGITTAQAGAPKKAGAWSFIVGGTHHSILERDTQVLQMTLSGPQRRFSMVYLATGDCEAELGDFIASLVPGNVPPSAPAPAPVSASANWSVTQRADWVEATNGPVRVYLHYANASADAYNSVLRAGLQNAWNVLVAPHLSQVRDFALRPIQSYESISFAEADAVDSTQRSVHVVLFKKHDSAGRNGYVEVLAPDKATFEKTFGAWHNDEFGWDALANLSRLNWFQVDAARLPGTWSSTDFASISYFYVNTGGLAGTDATSLADAFTFDGQGGYSSDHSGASGAAGNAKFSRQTYRGKYSVSPTGLTLTNRFQGQSDTYRAGFQAVRGGLVLVMTDHLQTTKYLVKRK